MEEKELIIKKAITKREKWIIIWRRSKNIITVVIFHWKKHRDVK